MNKKRLLFLSWRDIKAPKMGGAEIFTHEMLKRANHNLVEAIHFSPEFSGCEKDEVIDGVRYVRRGNMLSVIKEARLFYKANGAEIDYVVDQCNTHRFFSRLWVEKNKRIFFIHQLTREIWFKNAGFPINLFGFLTETPLLKLSRHDLTITVSDSTKKDLLKLGFEDSKVTILPEGINFEHWKPEFFLEKEANSTFFYIGRFSNYKGIDDSLKAYGKLKKNEPSAKLWIAGKKNNDYINTQLMPIFKKYNLSWSDNIADLADVTFLGFLSEQEKLECMSRAHCLLFPSLREGWGLTITESAAVGTPSIVYNSPGVVDAVDNGQAGYLCTQNTVDELVKNMMSVIHDKNTYEFMRMSAYKFSLNFHWDHTAKAFETFLTNVKN